MKRINKISFFLVMMLAGLVALSNTTHAANFKPYEYTFNVDESTTETFNGIKGIKQLDITFDQNIPVTTIASSDVFVEVSEEIKGGAATSTTLDIVENTTISADKKTLSVHFKNLDYLDYTNKSKVYKLIIKSSSGVYVAQIGNIVLPFAVHDLLPGFKSIFLDSLYNEIDSKVFIENPPRDIYVHIPKSKQYITKIETIHRYKGIVSAQEAATLTNIDVFTDPEVTRLKVDLDKTLIRDLDPHPSIKGFTMGYANDQNIGVEDLKEFTLKAYNDYGRILDEVTFRINYVNNENLGNNQIKVSNYITKKSNDFGKTFTLYELMSKEKILESILTSISVADLNKLGVTYANQFSTVNVGTPSQFAMALANPKIKTINLTNNITAPAAGLLLNHDVTINGNGKEITGVVKLGDGTKDLNIELNNLDISNTLTVDVRTGNVIADNVTVKGASSDPAINASVIILSGGINSIHFINLEAASGIFIKNAAPVRVVVTNSDDKAVNATLASDKEVILEGNYGTVTSNHANATLTVKQEHTIKINKFSIGDGMKLTVTRPNSNTVLPDSGYDENKLKIITLGEVTDPDEDQDNAIDLGKTNVLEAIKSVWGTTGKEISFSNIEIPSEITKWEVFNENAFGGVSKIVFLNGSITIENLSISEETERNIILRAIYEGKTYNVTVPIKVTVK